MFETIWMCTQEWSLIRIRATAFTFAACHQPLSCVSALTRSSSRRSLRLPRTGTLIFISATAWVGVRRVSRSASAEAGCSILSSVSRSRLTATSLVLELSRFVLVPDGVPIGLGLGDDGPVRIRKAVIDDAESVARVGSDERARQ